jgi:PKD repeat protein
MRKMPTLFLALALSASAFPVNTVTPTTTLAAETGNNTSAANSFISQSNGNLGATNISKVPTRTLLYSGATTRLYVHFMPWFGKTNHMNIGYNSSDPAQVARQVEDMASRGFDGAIADWYGPESTLINNSTLALRDYATKRGNFEFAVTEDVGALNTCAATAGCDVTQKMINDLTYAWNTFEQSPMYTRYNGRPVVFFFGVEKYAIDWVRAKTNTPGNPLFIFRNSGAFTKTSTDGGFAWVAPSSDKTNIALSYLDGFYSTALKYPSELTYGSAWKGFNDTLAGWSANRIMNQNCGQTWLSTWTEAAKYYSVSRQMYAFQVATWNDYEEATEIESGIENCVAVSGAVNGNTLTWSITGQENTVDHYTVFASLDGQNLMRLTDVATGVGTLDLAQYGFGPAQYTIYVKAVGRPSIRNQMSAPIGYTIANQPPVAMLAVTPTSGIAPVSVSASTAGSTDSDGSIASTTIDFGDGTVLPAGSASHTYAAPGTYTVVATVTDNLGASSTQAAVVTVVANQPPQALLSVTPATGISPLTVTVSTAASTDVDGTIASSVIAWGDGSISPGPTATHIFATPGIYAITATVTDDRGASSNAMASVSVGANQPPVARLTVTPASGIAPVTATASTMASTDTDGTIASSTVDWGDGASSTGPTATHVYNTPGTYLVSACVTDDRGAKSCTGAKFLVLANQAPLAKLTVTPTTGIAPATVTATTSGSTDADGTIASAGINWGDGTSTAAASGSHIYTRAGTYTITATVKDDRGATSTVTSTVTMNWGVTVTTPTNNASSTSPVHFIASASSSVTTVAMKIYVDSIAAYSINAAKLDTWVAMKSGTRYVVVQSWDANGVVYKTPIYVNVK